MAINFPDPSASPWYNDPTTGGNGITYEYTTEGYWKAVDVTGNNAIDEGTGNALYVNKVGDNMTGDLTLGTDRITLNAGTGAATFAGNINIGDVDGTNTVANGTLLYESGNVYIQRSALAIATEPCITQLYGGSINDRVFETLTDGSVFIGGSPNNSSRTPNISLFADGSATFAGTVSVAHPDGVSSNNVTIRAKNTDTPDTDTDVCLEIYSKIADDSTFNPARIRMRADGSATFAGGVTGSYFVSNNGGIDVLLSGNNVNNDGARLVPGSGGDNNPKLLLNKGGTTTVTLNGGDGSAEFAGGSLGISSNGFIDITSPFGGAQNTVIIKDNNSNPNIVLKSDGSASFAGLTEWKNADILRCRVNPNGSSNGGEINLNGADGSSKISLFGHDGSARFIGQVNSPLYTGTAALGSSRSSWESYATGDRSSGTSASWMGWAWQVKSGSSNNYAKTRIGLLLKDEYGFPSEPQIVFSNSGVTASNITFNLEPDNAAHYTTTTDNEGNTTEVYNGPSIDVKRTLQALATALATLAGTSTSDYLLGPLTEAPTPTPTPEPTPNPTNLIPDDWTQDQRMAAMAELLQEYQANR